MRKPTGCTPSSGVLHETAVAWASLQQGEGRRRHSGSLGISVHDEHWGKGIARSLLDALLDIADNWLGLIRLELEGAPQQCTGAIKLYENAGFEEEGRRRAAVLTNGQLMDSLLMARLRPAPAWSPA